MSDKVQNIALTNYNTDNMSRHNLLEWVNRNVRSQYKKIEELCSGVAYCQLFNILFPQSINMKKVKMQAKLEHEYIHNLKIFQSAFSTLDINKAVPIDRLIKGRFQDNLEFLQWFKKFFDTYSDMNCNASPSKISTRKPVSELAIPTSGKFPSNRAASPKRRSGVNNERLKVIQAELQSTKEDLIITKYERDYYYKQIQDIECFVKLCLDDNAAIDKFKQILDIICDEYAATDAVTSAEDNLN